MIIQITGHKKNGIMHCWEVKNTDRDKIEKELIEDGWTIVSIE